MFASLLALTVSAFYLPHEEKSFLSFMRTHNQLYTGEEYYFRLGIFLTNLRQVKEFNAGNHGYKLGINQFSAMTPTECKAFLGALPPKSLNHKFQGKKMNGAAPENLDWREKGIVNKVKDQAQCGSCWAFSAIFAQESQWSLVKGELLILSEQNMVDCVADCMGCNGGWPSSCYKHVVANQNGQYNLEADYPYKAIDQPCQWDADKGKEGCKSYIEVVSGDEDDLKEKVAQYGPASICIDATSKFMTYSTGIFDDKSCSTVFLNHAVGCVGYGVEGGVDYWIVRNSWAEVWGEKGYIRMSRNKNNQCGVATTAIIPVVA